MAARDEAGGDARPRARSHRAARRRRRDSVRAPAERRLRRLATDGARRPRRSRSRGLSRPAARLGHVRQRAEDRAGADDDVVHRRHAAPRAHAGERDARPPRRPGRGSSRPLAPRVAVGASARCRPAPACGWREHGDRDRAHPRVARSRASRRPISRSGRSTSSSATATGSSSSAGEQTIEPTVTDEDESKALGVPLHSPAFRFERVTHSQAGEIVEFVESIYRGDRYRLVTSLSIPQERRRARADGRDGGRRRRAVRVVSTNCVPSPLSHRRLR